MTNLVDLSTATREELSVIWKAIADEIGDDRFFTTKELDSLPALLSPYEQVLAFSSGLHEGNTWLIALTDQRVILLDKGLFFGLKQTSIEIDRINNIESKSGLLFGSISIGSNAKAYEITNVWKKTVIPFSNKTREAMRAKTDRVQMRSPGSDEVLSKRSGGQDSNPHAPPAAPAPPTYTPPAPQPAPQASDSPARQRMRAAGMTVPN